jgi:hypothetical protein
MRPGRLSRGRQLPQPIYKRRSLYLGRRAKREYIVRVLTPAEAEAQRRPSPDVWQEWQKVLRDGDELISSRPIATGALKRWLPVSPCFATAGRFGLRSNGIT